MVVAEVTTVVVLVEYGWVIAISLGSGLGLEFWVGLTFYGGVWTGLW